MPQHKDNRPTVPESAVYPEIAAVLRPGERVYWQGRPRAPSLFFNAGMPILLLVAIVWFGGYTDALLAIWQSYSLPTLLPFLLVPVIFCGLIIASQRYKAGLFRYALTSQRALSLKRRRIEQEASPEQLRVFDVIHRHGGTGFLRWRNAAAPVSESRNLGFYRAPRGLTIPGIARPGTS